MNYEEFCKSMIDNYLFADSLQEHVISKEQARLILVYAKGYDRSQTEIRQRETGQYSNEELKRTERYPA